MVDAWAAIRAKPAASATVDLASHDLTNTD
jgi:hypothetical protein